MNRVDELTQEIAELRDRLSRLSDASLRVNESLDLEDVLQGVLHSARTLTDARYVVITTLDDEGRIEELRASGLTAEETRSLWEVPEGQQFFDYLNAIAEPLRVPDLGGHASALGLTELRTPVHISAFLAVPIRYRGVGVGNIHVGKEEPGQEFSREDEETLVMFASQVALVVANARRHRDERRAKTGLETLIETSPMGVVVFDAKEGVPVSFNREATRIVGGLINHDQTTEQLTEVLTVRRADGSEFSLAEFPLAEVLSNSTETVRAEEIVLAVPGGRSISVLINATPIRSEGDGVESVVLTMQDMTPLEELERLRAEFLAMVSHELRAPLTSIKGSAATVLGSSGDLDPAVVRQFLKIIEEQADHMNELVADLLDVARIETGTLPVNPEPAEVAVLVDRARSAFTNGGGANHLAIDIEPDLPLVMVDRRRVVQVLGNLLTNAARNSSALSVIRVTAVQEDVHLAISVTDEGRGIPAESLPHLFRKFSTVQSEEGGDTGLGLAICKGIVEAHGGRIWAESEGPGLGARFTFTLPTVDGPRSGTAGRFPPVSEHSSRRAESEDLERVRVLAVDDDPQALRYIRDTLTQSGYEPIVTGEPEEAVRLMAAWRPELVLLDLMLPGTDGIELMKPILQIADVPIIFLSAYGREELIARAFDMGAVDYVVKPFSPTELTARIRGALRRRAAAEPADPYVLGDLVINFAERSATLAGRRVELVALEYRMLAELSANAGRIMSYEQLLERVWGEKSSGDVRPMRTIVSKLRRKLGENAANPTYIFTETRVGYRMAKGETPE